MGGAAVQPLLDDLHLRCERAQLRCRRAQLRCGRAQPLNTPATMKGSCHHFEANRTRHSRTHSHTHSHHRSVKPLMW